MKILRKLRRNYLQNNFRKQYEVGDFSYGIPKVFCWGEAATLKIGKFCSISTDVQIFLGGEHRTDWISTYPFSDFFEKAKGIPGHPHTKGDVVIGNDVWVAHGATILSGVSIGDGAVIGAGSVVTRNVTPYTIVAGNPARVIKLRFEPEIVEQLLMIRWWDWSVEKIIANVPLLMDGNVNVFVAKHGIEIQKK